MARDSRGERRVHDADVVGLGVDDVVAAVQEAEAMTELVHRDAALADPFAFGDLGLGVVLKPPLDSQSDRLRPRRRA